MNARWLRLWLVIVLFDALILAVVQVASRPERMAPDGHRAGGRIIAKGCTVPLPLECWVVVSHWAPNPDWVIRCCSPDPWGAWEVTIGTSLGDYLRSEVGDWYDAPSVGGGVAP